MKECSFFVMIVISQFGGSVLIKLVYLIHPSTKNPTKVLFNCQGSKRACKSLNLILHEYIYWNGDFGINFFICELNILYQHVTTLTKSSLVDFYKLISTTKSPLTTTCTLSFFFNVARVAQALTIIVWTAVIINLSCEHSIPKKWKGSYRIGGGGRWEQKVSPNKHRTNVRLFRKTLGQTFRFINIFKL